MAVQAPASPSRGERAALDEGPKDVGLSVKTSGNNHNGFATDIVTLAPLDAPLTTSNFEFADALLAAATRRRTSDGTTRSCSRIRSGVDRAAETRRPGGATRATHTYVGGGKRPRGLRRVRKATSGSSP